MREKLAPRKAIAGTISEHSQVLLREGGCRSIQGKSDDEDEFNLNRMKLSSKLK